MDSNDVIFSVQTNTLESVDGRCVLYAGGSTTGGSGVKQWDGLTSQWLAFGGGIIGSGGSFGDVNSLEYGNIGEGDSLYVLGRFSHVGDPQNPLPANNVARWDGSQWHSLGSGLTLGSVPKNGSAHVLFIFDDGSGARLFAGGNFVDPLDPNSEIAVAVWDGSSWQPAAAGFDSPDVVWDFCSFDDGSGEALYAAGGFLRPDSGSDLLAKWNGSSWVKVATGTPSDSVAHTLETWNDGTGVSLYMGGMFEQVEGIPATNAIARLDGQGQGWSSVGGGMSNNENIVFDLAVYDDGSGSALYATGAFTIPELSSDNIAKWDTVSWSTLDNTGLNSTGGRAMVVHDTGSGAMLVVGGPFSSPASKIAQWGGCVCVADVNQDGILDFSDMQMYLNWYSVQDARSDMNCDGLYDFFDVQIFWGLYAAGCN